MEIRFSLCSVILLMLGWLLVAWWSDRLSFKTQDQGTNLLCQQIVSLLKCPERKSQPGKTFI